MASQDFQMKPVERFNLDGLAYDATLMIEGGRAFPVAFNESVSVQEAQSNLAFSPRLGVGGTCRFAVRPRAHGM